MSNKYKIIITPGIIEQGANNKNVAIKIAQSIMNICDFVCLVSENSKNIEEYLLTNGFKSVKCFSSFLQAWEYVKNIDENKIVLIENDLPNIYLK